MRTKTTTCPSHFGPRAPHRRISAAVVLVMTTALLTLAAGPARASATYVVHPGSGCSDTGPGTSAIPLCTMTAAAKRAVAGDAVQVDAGTYREQVNVPSGVTFRATSSSAVVLGTDDYSGATWTSTGAGLWSTTVAGTVTPWQVFLDNAPLTKVTGTPTAAGTWSWDATTRTITVDTGGPAPSVVEVGTRQYGFVLGSPTAGVTGATVDGFTVRRPGGAGVLLRSGTSSSAVTNVTVTESGGYGINDEGGSANTLRRVRTVANTSIGIRLSGASGDLVDASTSDHNGFHGVSVQGGSGNTLRGLVTTANKKPGTRVAAGIDVSQGSVGAVVERSTSYGNDDSGIEIYTGSSNATVRRNLSYDNNDHGIDISKATGSTVLSNTVVGNATSGINVEGIATSTTIRDNIAAGNTVDPSRSVGDIRVEAGSEPGTTLDRDLLFESSATGIVAEWKGVNYTASTFDQFRTVSGQEATGLVADPRFVSSSARDLRLQGTSPGIDRADTGDPHWSAADLDGYTPVNDPKVADFAGTSADLGAREYRGAIALPPSVAPTSGSAMAYVVDARNSGTLGETQSAFVLDCGNGTSSAARQTTCTYASPGTYTIRVSVTGAVVAGASYTDAASRVLTVQADAPPTAALTLSPFQVQQGATVTADGSGSTDDHGIVSYGFDCGDGTGVQTGSVATRSCAYAAAGSYTVTLTVTDTRGQSASASGTVEVVPSPIPAPIVTPVVTSPLPPIARLVLSRHRVRRHRPVVADASSSYGSPGTPVTAYRFGCGNRVRTTWTTSPAVRCRYRRAGRYVIRVKVRNSAGLIAIARQIVRVRR